MFEMMRKKKAVRKLQSELAATKAALAAPDLRKRPVGRPRSNPVAKPRLLKRRAELALEEQPKEKSRRKKKNKTRKKAGLLILCLIIEVNRRTISQKNVLYIRSDYMQGVSTILLHLVTHHA